MILIIFDYPVNITVQNAANTTQPMNIIYVIDFLNFMKFEKIQYNIINCQLDEKPNEIKWTKLGFDIIVHPEGLNGNGTIRFITTK